MFDTKQKETSSKITELEIELNNLKDIEVTRKNKMDQINKIQECLTTYKKLDIFNEEVFNTLIDKIVISEVLDNETEDLYKITFILKTGEMIVNNLPNNKIKVGTELGQYGFRLKKQVTNNNDDKLSAYVLDRNSTINCCIFSHILIISLSTKKRRQQHT